LRLTQRERSIRGSQGERREISICSTGVDWVAGIVEVFGV
jgi:hypothetical protein